MPQAIREHFLSFSVSKGFRLTEKSLGLDEETLLYQAEEICSQSAIIRWGARSEFDWLLGKFGVETQNTFGTSYRCQGRLYGIVFFKVFFTMFVYFIDLQ